jgi:RluA family pseudouridine synthase
MSFESMLEEWHVRDLEQPMRLQDVLPKLCKDNAFSRKGCKKAIQRNRVLLNGAPGATGDWVDNGDKVALLQAKQNTSVPIHDPLRIGFQDDDVLVVWKNAGIHTSGNHRTSLRAQVASIIPHSNQPNNLVHPEPAHRLDYATSGWVIFGRTVAALQFLNADFKHERVKKTYWAIVNGTPPYHLTINLPLANKTASTHAICWGSGSIPTRGEGSLMQITTGTGRTHQIRKHLQSIQHSIVGDDRYEPKPHYAGHGLLLCANQIEFRHPISQKTVELKASFPRKFNRFRWVKNLLATIPLERVH